MANAIRRICSGTISAVSSPMMPSSSVGFVKPALSRSNHCGAETAEKISMMIASALATGRIPRLQRSTRNAISR